MMYFQKDTTTCVVFCQCKIWLEEVIVTKYQRLRDLREDHDLTQDQLVAILGMHKTTYTNYEQGKREIPFCLAIRLALYYDVSLDYIAGLTQEARSLRTLQAMAYR